MSKPITIRVSDVCILHVKPKRINESDIHCMKFSTLIAQPKFDSIRSIASDIFTAVGLSRCACPDVWYTGDDGLLLIWSESIRHFLHVRILPDSGVSYFVTHQKNDVTTKWIDVVNLSTLDEVMFKLGCYMAGKKESEIRDAG